jgi:Sec-independent protein translocase protein TatA
MNIFGIGIQELLIILLICLLIFGETINSFKKALKEDSSQDKNDKIS